MNRFIEIITSETAGMYIFAISGGGLQRNKKDDTWYGQYGSPTIAEQKHIEQYETRKLRAKVRGIIDQRIGRLDIDQCTAILKIIGDA